MSHEQYRIEGDIEDALEGLPLEDQRSLLQGLISRCEDLLDKVDMEIQEEEEQEEEEEQDS